MTALLYTLTLIFVGSIFYRSETLCAVGLFQDYFVILIRSEFFQTFLKIHQVEEYKIKTCHIIFDVSYFLLAEFYDEQFPSIGIISSQDSEEAFSDVKRIENFRHTFIEKT